MVMRLTIFSLLLLPFTALAEDGLMVQSYEGNATGTGQVYQAPVVQAPTPPRVIQRTAPAATSQQDQKIMGYYDAPRQAVSNNAEDEYKGYFNKTLVQAYLGCKYESFRAATPGDNTKSIPQKMRMRIYVMDTCMNREGYFRNKPLPMLDFSLLTSGDIFRW